MKQIDVREGALRQHRSLALFAVIQCWLRGLDGVVFRRRHLERVLGLERFKQQRVTWLQDDLKDFFPYQKARWYTVDEYGIKPVKEGARLGSLFVSRVPLEPYLGSFGASSEEYVIDSIPDGGPKLGVFEIWSPLTSQDAKQLFEAVLPFFSDAANYDERLLASYLSLPLKDKFPHKAYLR